MTVNLTPEINWADMIEAGIDTALVERAPEGDGFVAKNADGTIRVAFAPSEDVERTGPDDEGADLGWDGAAYEWFGGDEDGAWEQWEQEHFDTAEQVLAWVKDRTT